MPIIETTAMSIIGITDTIKDMAHLASTSECLMSKISDVESAINRCYESVIRAYEAILTVKTIINYTIKHNINYVI